MKLVHEKSHDNARTWHIKIHTVSKDMTLIHGQGKN